MSINKIVEGHFNSLIDKNKELLTQRMQLCRSCVLYKIDSIFGEMCNKHLYVNTKTGETSEVSKPGFYNGCGCRLVAKTRLVDEICPIKK